VSFAAITLCVASQRVFITVVYFVIDSVRKLLDIPSYQAASNKYGTLWSAQNEALDPLLVMSTDFGVC
jgi:hypothetical protein